MKYLLLNIIFLFSFFSFSQKDKRLALVIGNSNYVKGELKNPVNDARLIAKTLNSLNFEVLLYENLKTQREFKDAVRNFGNKRNDYDIAFVYYAGHGIQIENENYLLATEEEYLSEIDVVDYSLSVQNILRYLESRTDQVNILILDACRDNPFENNWNKTRSIANQGLAKIPPPTGSLIAFSTDSGQTAPDGDGENSVYTLSLSKNLLLEQTTIDQIFRNVRAEILALSNGEQRPVEATQLTGEAFYLNPSSFKKEFKEIEEILEDDQGDFLNGITIVEKILNVNNSIQAQLLKARLLTKIGNYDKAEIEFENIISIDTLNVDAYFHFTTLYEEEKKYEKAIVLYNKAIEINPKDKDLYYYMTTPYEALGMYEEAEKNYLKAIALDPVNTNYYLALGILYRKELNNPEKALEQFKKIIQLDSLDIRGYNNIGNIYLNEAYDLQKSEEYLLRGYELDNNSFELNYNLATLYQEKEEYTLSVKYYNKAIEINPQNKDLYYNITTPYRELGMYEEAEKNYLKAIELDAKDSDVYLDLGELYEYDFKIYEKAISQYLKILEFKNEDHVDAYYYIARIYFYDLNDNEKAVQYLKKANDLYPNNSVINYMYGNINNDLGEFEKSIKYYKKAIEINPKDKNLYYNITTPYEALGMYEEAEKNYLKAIALDPVNTNYYLALGNLYKIELDDRNKAIEQFKKIIQLDSLDIGAYNNIGNIYLNEPQNLDLAEEYLLKGLKIDPNYHLFNLNLGRLYNFRNEYEKAIEFFKKCIDLKPEYDTAYYEITTSYKELEMYEEAEKNYLKAIALDPKDLNYYLALGNLYRNELNYPEKGISQYLKIIEIDSLYIQAYNNAGNLFLDVLNDLEKAEQYLIKAYEIDNNSHYVNYNLARLYEEKEEFTLSKDYYQRAIDLNPLNSYYFFRITTPLEELGLNDEAEKNYLKAIELEPKSNDYRDYLVNLYVNSLNQVDKAIDLINKGIKVNSEWERYFTKRLAEIHFENLNDNQHSLKLINNALEGVEESEYYASYYGFRGKIYQSLNKLEHAEDDFKKAILLDKSEVNHYFNLANFYISISELEKAEEKVIETINLSRNDPDGYYKLYYIELLKKNYFKALEFLTISIQKFKDSIANNESYYITDFDNLTKIELEDLYFKRAELKINLIGNNNSSCEDLNNALKISEVESIKELIKEKILLSCSN